MDLTDGQFVFLEIERRLKAPFSTYGYVVAAAAVKIAYAEVRFETG